MSGDAPGRGAVVGCSGWLIGGRADAPASALVPPLARLRKPSGPMSSPLRPAGRRAPGPRLSRQHPSSPRRVGAASRSAGDLWRPLLGELTAQGLDALGHATVALSRVSNEGSTSSERASKQASTQASKLGERLPAHERLRGPRGSLRSPRFVWCHCVAGGCKLFFLRELPAKWS
jgi:hypothetical protein